MNTRRLIAVSTALLVASTLTACLPNFPGPLRATPSPEPSASSQQQRPDDAADAYTGGTGSGTDAPAGEVVVLDDDEVTAYPVYTASTPAGTWDIGPGLPPGFPAGVPAFSGRWIEGEFHTYETGGRLAYSATFWGGYPELDVLVARLAELGFAVDDRRDDAKRAIVAETERYTVILNGAEEVADTINGGVQDPAYTYIVVFE